MANKGPFTRILAVVGTVLVWLPLLAPVLLAVPQLITGRMFILDYLIPAELFPVTLAGGALLIWAAVRARARWKWIGWCLGIAVVALVGSQALAVVSGLASGAIQPPHWSWTVVLGMLAVYCVALVGVGIGGIRLLREL